MSSRETLDTKRYQVCNYVLRVEAYKEFSYMGYYHQLDEKLAIIKITIYQSRSLEDFIFVFVCQRRRDVNVDKKGWIMTPKFFHIPEVNYPYFENNNSVYSKSRVYENEDKYTMLYKYETDTIEPISLHQHVISFSQLETDSDRLEYIKLYNLLWELEPLIKNVYMFCLLQIRNRIENKEPLEDLQHQIKSLEPLLQIPYSNKILDPSQQMPNLKKIEKVPLETVVSKDSLKQTSDVNKLSVEECLDTNDLSNELQVSYIFNPSNQIFLSNLLKERKEYKDSLKHSYSSLFKFSLVHFKIIKNPLKMGDKNGFLYDIFDLLPEHVRKPYQKYIDAYNNKKKS